MSDTLNSIKIYKHFFDILLPLWQNCNKNLFLMRSEEGMMTDDVQFAWVVRRSMNGQNLVFINYSPAWYPTSLCQF